MIEHIINQLMCYILTFYVSNATSLLMYRNKKLKKKLNIKNKLLSGGEVCVYMGITVNILIRNC